MSVPHPHQSNPLVYINGRSGVFAGDCSSIETTRRLLVHMQHYHFYDNQHHVTYPPSRAWQAYWKSWREKMGRRIARQIQEVADKRGKPVDIFAHSMGALLFWYAARELDCIRRVVLASPAMDRDMTWDHLNFDRMLVLRNPGDRALMWGSLLPWHPFGNAGRFGFLVNDPRMRDMKVKDGSRADFHRHSHYFREPIVHSVGYEVDRFLTGVVV